MRSTAPPGLKCSVPSHRPAGLPHRPDLLQVFARQNPLAAGDFVLAQLIGRIGDQELRGAQDAILQSAVQQKGAQQQLGSEVLAGFQKVVNVQSQAANEQARIAEEVSRLSQVLNTIQGAQQNNSARSRAQMGQRRG